MIAHLKKPWKTATFILALLFSSWLWCAPDEQTSKSKIVPTSKNSDVRVIIDISGSMRQNDPDNLRVPALNLIVELLPEGSRAGVWTFGQWVNMLVTPGQVNDDWRENAKLKAKSINSHGLRTNIGEAMEKATWKFENGSSFDQHVILLTDGLVDIASDKDSKQSQKNEAERSRILTKVLKRYQDLGVKIHTIGLSQNADKVLLDKLSLATGGMSEVVDNSEQLVKAFLKAFEKAAPAAAEQVPLSADNTFDIDDSVEEFTALIFRKKGSPPSQLTSPDGTVISQIKAAQNARWFSESVYDLVTVQNPQGGTWKIKADLDPDNRVTVVSDLKMEIVNLPTSLFPGQQVDFEVYLHENGEILSNKDFLRLMTVEMKMTAESGRSGTKQISDPENIPEDGRFRESIKRLSKEGQYELEVTVDGKTFKRMRKEYIQVRQPIGFEIRKRMVNAQEVYAVRVIPQVPDIEVARTRVIAKIKGPDQHSIIQAVPWVEEGVWESIIDVAKGPGVYEVVLNVKGRYGEDQEFRIKPNPILLNFPIPADFSHEYFVEEDVVASVADAKDELADKDSELPEGEVIADDAAQSMPEKPPEEEPVESTETQALETEKAQVEVVAEEVTEEAEPIPFWLYILIPVLTLFMGVGGFFVYRLLAKKKSKGNTEEKVVEEAPPEMSAPPPEVSLNDGMDDEEFDEDFDLSDSDEDDDGFGDLDLSSDEEEDVEDVVDDVADEDETQEDEIPDFDENFDIDADVDIEPEENITAGEDDTSAAIDELDDVLDSLTDDEDDIPNLEDEVLPEEPEVEEELNEEGDALDNADGEAAIDEALASLESELDDIDVDGLVDEEGDDNS